MHTAVFLTWSTAMVGQLFLCFLFTRKYANRHPSLKAFVVAQVACSLLALLAYFLSPLAYFMAYYFGMVAGSVSLLFCVLETYSKVFGPRASIPRLVPEKTASMIACSFAVAIAMGLLGHARFGGQWTRAMVTTEQVVTVGSWAAFLILVVYSRQIFLPWIGNTAKITAGFVLYLSVDVAAVLVRSWSVNHRILLAAGLAGQIGYLLAIAWWCWSLRVAEEFHIASGEEVKEVLARQKSASELLGQMAAQISKWPVLDARE